MHNNQIATATDSDSVLRRKITANSYLPRLACAFVQGEIDIELLCQYFEQVAHLYTVGIDVNAICNLSCGYCYLANYNRQTAPHYIDLLVLRSFLDEITTRGVDLVAIVGKEPFADDRGIRVLRFLHEMRTAGRSFRYGVVTNGTLVGRYIDELPSTISYADISLDGDARVTDRMRGCGVYSKAVTSLKALVNRNVDTWVSSVIYSGTSDPAVTMTSMVELFESTGCGKFYLSPVRNFTGDATDILLRYRDISAFQDRIAELASRQTGITHVILDHPYEAVWRDYIFTGKSRIEESLGSLKIDEFGNLLHPLSENCFRKLDVFPHGPWGTCRIDARGAYLADVESRTFAAPETIGFIGGTSAHTLHRTAMRDCLRPMLERFLENMYRAAGAEMSMLALTGVSVPIAARAQAEIGGSSRG